MPCLRGCRWMWLSPRPWLCHSGRRRGAGSSLPLQAPTRGSNLRPTGGACPTVWAFSPAPVGRQRSAPLRSQGRNLRRGLRGLGGSVSTPFRSPRRVVKVGEFPSPLIPQAPAVALPHDCAAGGAVSVTAFSAAMGSTQ